MEQALRRGELYELADRLPYDIISTLVRPEDKEDRDVTLAHMRVRGRIRARWTGHYRPPKQGEWYLSGAQIQAYRAPNDLTMPFHLAELVETAPPAPQPRIVLRTIQTKR